MVHKWLSLVLCLAALMPQQVCTCLHAAEHAAEIEHAHDDDHSVPLPCDHDHDTGCLAIAPIPPAVIVPASMEEYDFTALVLLGVAYATVPEASFRPPSHNELTSQFRPLHVPIVITQCTFQL